MIEASNLLLTQPKFEGCDKLAMQIINAAVSCNTSNPESRNYKMHNADRPDSAFDTHLEPRVDYVNNWIDPASQHLATAPLMTALDAPCKVFQNIAAEYGVDINLVAELALRLCNPSSMIPRN